MCFRPGSFQFSVFQFFNFLILKKNFCGPLKLATSFYIRKTFLGPPKPGLLATSGARANTLAIPEIEGK